MSDAVMPGQRPVETLPAVHGGAELPALVDAGTRALMQATTNLERLRVRDYGKAVEAVAQIAGRAEVLVEASVLVQTAERVIAQANPAPAPETTGRGHKTAPTGLDPKLVRTIRSAHARVDDKLFRRLVAEARESHEPLTRKRVAHAGREAEGMASPKTVHYSGEYEWTTPPHIIAAAKRVMGDIDLDPASSIEAQRVVQAKSFCTEHEDGLKRAWSGRVWLNPPYKLNLVRAFTERLLEHISSGKVSQAILLANNSTDTDWWHRAASAALAMCLPAGRMRFLTPAGHPTGSPIQGQSILYFAHDVDDGIERFGQEFCRHGLIFYPVLFPEVT